MDSVEKEFDAGRTKAKTLGGYDYIHIIFALEAHARVVSQSLASLEKTIENLPNIWEFNKDR